MTVKMLIVLFFIFLFWFIVDICQCWVNTHETKTVTKLNILSVITYELMSDDFLIMVP